MDRLKKVLDPLTCALVLLAVAFMALLFYTRGLMEKRANESAEPSDVVVGFLDAYLAAKGNHQREVVVERFIAPVDTSSLDHSGRSETLLKIDAVLQPTDRETLSYRICVSQRNYLEFMLVDSNGKDLPCRIAFFYRTTGTDKISSFTLARLQPLNRSDPEWRSAWQ